MGNLLTKQCVEMEGEIIRRLKQEMHGITPNGSDDAIQVLSEEVSFLDKTAYVKKAVLNPNSSSIMNSSNSSSNSNSSNQYLVGWVLDSATNSCMLCERTFNIIFRKHHCRVCGFVICDPCSKNRLKVPAIEKEESFGSRVCDHCYEVNKDHHDTHKADVFVPGQNLNNKFDLLSKTVNPRREEIARLARKSELTVTDLERLLETDDGKDGKDGKLSGDTKVYFVKIKGIRDIPEEVRMHGWETYVEITYVNKEMDCVSGPQTQKTSLCPSVSDTFVDFDPPEKFRFVGEFPETSKIRFTLFALKDRATVKIDALGFGNFSLSSLTSSLTSPRNNQQQPPSPMNAAPNNASSSPFSPSPVDGASVVKFISAQSGKPCGAVELEWSCAALREAVRVSEQLLFEFERWQPVVEWGSRRPGHFLPTDPGRWINYSNGKGEPIHDDDFDKVEPKIPQGWTAGKWIQEATKSDPGGWAYATDHYALTWCPVARTDFTVRRRAWRRELTRD